MCVCGGGGGGGGGVGVEGLYRACMRAGARVCACVVECERAYMVPCYNSSICYCHLFEQLFLMDQINLTVSFLMLCLLVVNLT